MSVCSSALKTVSVFASFTLNINGKTIQSLTSVNPQQITLKINEPAGIYFLHIETRDKKTVMKLIKN